MHSYGYQLTHTYAYLPSLHKAHHHAALISLLLSASILVDVEKTYHDTGLMRKD